MSLPQLNASYRAWLFDLDGTLYSARGVKFFMGFELLVAGGWSAISVLRKFRKMHERLRDAAAKEQCVQHVLQDPLVAISSASPPLSPYRCQIEATAQALNRSPESVERVVQLWMFERPAKWLRLFRNRKLLQQIHAFRARGGRTALVSDYPARRKLAALGAQDLFDVVIASGECASLHTLKPAPEGYLLAAALLGVDTKECLVVGDRNDADGEAARCAGMHFRNVHS